MATGHFEFPDDSYSFTATFKEFQPLEEQSNTYILQDPNGNEVVAVLVDERTVFDATANDIRLGKVAATDAGVTTGEKVIPSYNTSEGVVIVPIGSVCKITHPDYDYTKLQGLLCEFNTSLLNSVCTSKVVINDNVYDVNSVSSLAVLTKDHDRITINFNVVNDTNKMCVIRYFMYKEIY